MDSDRLWWVVMHSYAEWHIVTCYMKIFWADFLYSCRRTRIYYRFHNKRAGIGGKNQLFQPPTGGGNCCSQGQQIRLSFSIPQYFTVIFFPALNHDECGGTGKRMHATHRLKEHIPTFLICYLTARGRLTVCQKNWKRKRRKLVNQLLIVASISVSLAARKDISQATYAMFFF